MSGLFSQLTGNGDDDGNEFYTSYETYMPQYLPEPGTALEGHRLLTGEDHIRVHQLAKKLFEDRGVYDMTFGYNLAKLNLDTRHPEAGYRYALDGDDDSVLHAEFTPTTPFCPQSDTLTIGSFRAWNGLAEQHEFDIVKVSVAATHHRSDNINAELRALEQQLLKTGSISGADFSDLDSMQAPTEEYPSPDKQPEAPF